MKETHIHLSKDNYDQIYPYITMNGDDFIIKAEGTREKIIEEMKRLGIECCIDPAIDVDSNERSIKLSKQYPGFIYSAIGNHPTRCVSSTFSDFRRVMEYAKDETVIAIGETGLDYHLERKEQHRIKQKIWFQFLINLADKMGLPLILHIRKANEDGIKILRRNKRRLHGGVVHCFGSPPDIAKIYTEELELCIGVGGTLLMNDIYSLPLQESVKAVPIECILLETDGPYVRPSKPDTEKISKKKWQKARNTSLILPAVIKRIAELKDMSYEEVERITSDNTKRVFGV